MPKKETEWIKFAKEHYKNNKKAGYTYTDALKEAGPLFKQMKGTAQKEAPTGPTVGGKRSRSRSRGRSRSRSRGRSRQRSRSGGQSRRRK